MPPPTLSTPVQNIEPFPVSNALELGSVGGRDNEASRVLTESFPVIIPGIR